MDAGGKATSLWRNFFRWQMPQIRAFHLSWMAFFLCFFAWFGVAPLMPIVREELGLTKQQIGACLIASVSITVLARMLIGVVCDRIGPRLAYTWLLMLGSLPVMGIGLAHDFTTFLVFRLLIGAIGAAFVITQYHTSVMFAGNCVGTANATSAGWGNLGGGVTQFTMPLLFGLLMSVFGFSQFWAWRLAMVVAGVLCMAVGVAYYFLTQDTPQGNFSELRATGRMPAKRSGGSFLEAARDYRVWALFAVYGMCFGVELTIKNVAVLYFVDDFGLGLKAAGFAAGAYGLMNLFARTLGGVLADRCGARWGLNGRVTWLFAVLFCEGLVLMLFSQMRLVAPAVAALVLLGLFVQMSNGATYAVVPFVNPRCLGSVSGIVGAGGNTGAVLAGLLFQGSLAWNVALLVLGITVTCCSFVALGVRFSSDHTASLEADREAGDRELGRAAELAAAGS